MLLVNGFTLKCMSIQIKCIIDWNKPKCVAIRVEWIDDVAIMDSHIYYSYL